jgi:N-glycosylase/DNA lyase
MEAFPVDVWIKRIMERVYYEGNDIKKEVILEFAKEHFGEYGGYAQQYLFYYARDEKSK